MSLENFKPLLLADKIEENLRKQAVYGGLTDIQYEGQLSKGKEITVSQIGDVSVGDYTKYNDITWEQLDDAAKKLVIDQQKYFAFEVDDIDEKQTIDGLIGAGQGNGLYQLGDTMDQYIAGKWSEAGITGTGLGTLGTPLAVNSANVDEVFVNAGLAMDEANVPSTGRVAVIPAWLGAKLTLAEVGLLTENRESYVNGYLGTINGFQLFQSNNVSEASARTNSKVMFMVEGATIALAQQIVNVKMVDRENRFSTGIKGLHVYGAKTMRPDMLLTAYLSETTES